MSDTRKRHARSILLLSSLVNLADLLEKHIPADSDAPEITVSMVHAIIAVLDAHGVTTEAFVMDTLTRRPEAALATAGGHLACAHGVRYCAVEDRLLRALSDYLWTVYGPAKRAKDINARIRSARQSIAQK